ncbi:hypothetical protein ACWDY4_44690 [Streptomyces olivaceoviridis]
MRRMITTVLGALALTATSVGLWAAPASASDVYQGSDWATHAYDGTWFDYCDGEDDNHSVWGGYYTTASSAYQTSSPVNGYCGTEFVRPGGGRLRRGGGGVERPQVRPRPVAAGPSHPR